MTRRKTPTEEVDLLQRTWLEGCSESAGQHLGDHDRIALKQALTSAMTFGHEFEAQEEFVYSKHNVELSNLLGVTHEKGKPFHVDLDEAKILQKENYFVGVGIFFALATPIDGCIGMFCETHIILKAEYRANWRDHIVQDGKLLAGCRV